MRIKSNNQIIILTIFLAFIILSSIFQSCSTSKIPENATVEDFFRLAMEEYNDEDYLEAKNFFDVIKLQYPASEYADDAQFYLGEVNFNNKDYIIAAYHYSSLRRDYRHSTYYKQSMFKTGLCYYNLSPEYDRYQEYTVKAIQSFSEFQSIYPNDSLAVEAGNYIKELREKLAHREYFTAELYRKIMSPESALVYYESTIDNYNDTKYLELAYIGKIEVLVLMKKFEEALVTIDFFKKNFQPGESMDKISLIEKSIPK